MSCSSVRHFIFSTVINIRQVIDEGLLTHLDQQQYLSLFSWVRNCRAGLLPSCDNLLKRHWGLLYDQSYHIQRQRYEPSAIMRPSRTICYALHRPTVYIGLSIIYRWYYINQSINSFY